MAASLKLGTLRAQRSFEAIYNAHVRDVYRYAFALTGNAADAEDVTQTTFMNAFRAFRDGERPEKPQNWLLTIAHNVCRQRARVAARRPLEVAFDEDVAAALVPDVDAPSATDIRRALGHLPYSQRATLVMRELEGRSHAEIAGILGISVPAAEMLAFRARRALREQLAGSLTCQEAAAALDRQSDGTLGHEEAGLLRAHLRECTECERMARRIRAQRSAWRALAVVPVPASLNSFAGAGGGAVGVSAALLVKAAAITVAASTAAGGAYVLRNDIGRQPGPARTTPGAKAPSHRAATTPAATHRPSTNAAPHRTPAPPTVAVTRPSPPAIEAVTTTSEPPAASTEPAAEAQTPTVTTDHAPPARKGRVKPHRPQRKDVPAPASSCAATPRKGASPCSKGSSRSQRP